MIAAPGCAAAVLERLGQVLAINVDCPSHERRFSPQRESQWIERMIKRPERRRLRDLSNLARRRILTFCQSIDLVVEQENLDRNVSTKCVDQMVATDRQGISIARNHPDEQVGS